MTPRIAKFVKRFAGRTMRGFQKNPENEWSATMRVVHKKRGTAYETVGEGLVQCDRPMVDMDKVMIYKDPYDGHLWVRPVGEFNDGRFRFVDEPK